MTATDIYVIAGEPFTRRITIDDGTNVWPTLADVEARSQVRAGRYQTDREIYDLTPHLTVSIDGADLVVVLALTGADTRALAAAMGTHTKCYYDMFLSDPGPTDTRAVKIQYGRVDVEPNVTAGT